LSRSIGRVSLIAIVAAIVALLVYLKPKKSEVPGPGAPAPAGSAAHGAAPASGTVPAAGGAPSAAASPAAPASPAPAAQAQKGPAGPAVPVTARVLRANKLENSITSTGNVLANEDVEIRSEVQGKIVRIAFKEGARAKKGDLLVKIDDSELRAKVVQAAARRKLAEDNEYRMRKQLEIQAVSQKDYEQSASEVALAKGDVQLLKAQIDKTELRAPFSGVLGLKLVSEGAYVSPNTLITTLQEIDPVKIDFTVPGKYFGFMKPGLPIRFLIQGSDTRFQGKIYAVEPRIDPESRTLRLRALCPNAEGRIPPGAFATIEVTLQTVESALTVPTEALSADARGSKVYLFKGGKAEPRPVQAGLRTDSLVQIMNGLSAGDTVITSGVVQIRPGAAVSLAHLD
jgi:membrane fusion protein, multidrug efflux system